METLRLLLARESCNFARVTPSASVKSIVTTSSADGKLVSMRSLAVCDAGGEVVNGIDILHRMLYPMALHPFFLVEYWIIWHADPLIIFPWIDVDRYRDVSFASSDLLLMVRPE